MAGLKASKDFPKNNFKRPDPLEPGSYPARVVRVYDLGLQPQQPYQGKAKPPAHEISVTYELSDEFMKDDNGNDLGDKPRWVSHTFVLNPITSDLANSTKAYKAIDPNMDHDGDWAALVGSPVMVNLVQNPSKKDKTKIYEKITSLTAMRKKEADKLPELKNEGKFFDLSEPDIELFNSLPQFLKDKITANLEFAGSPLEKLLAGGAPEKKQSQAQEEPEQQDQDGGDDTPW